MKSAFVTAEKVVKVSKKKHSAEIATVDIVLPDNTRLSPACSPPEAKLHAARVSAEPEGKAESCGASTA